MKILFTCGGTAGHINPAIALARLFQARKPDTDILFVGACGGMEEKLVLKEGFPIETVTVTSFRRKLNLAGLRYNLNTLRNLNTSRQEAGQILTRFQPDLVLGTGGYASYPLVREAVRCGIPTAVHESNAVPGLTTKRLARMVDCVMVGFSNCEREYPKPERVVVTGTPVRGDFFLKTRREAKEALGIPADATLVLSYWGSLGAQYMNAHMLDFIEIEQRKAPDFYHIHGAGRNYTAMQASLQQRGVQLGERIRLEDYIYDMPCVMAAADLVLCRGGASTLSELTAIGRAAIIVPSPHVTGDHQGKNARLLAERGGARVILEAESDGATLYRETSHLLTEKQERMEMERAMSAAGTPDAAEQIYQTLLKLLQKR